MATRKKKDTPNVDSGGWPKMQQGSHLTVKTFEDGSTELAWDDEALLKEVRAAIASAGDVDREDIPAPRVNSNPPKTTRTRAKKNV